MAPSHLVVLTCAIFAGATALQGPRSGCVGASCQPASFADCSTSCPVPMASQPSRDQIGAVYGKIQVVDSFPDYKVQVVQAFPDLKVQVVDAFADKPGKWQFVDSFPDYKIQFVDSFPDFKIQFVSAFPGLD